MLKKLITAIFVGFLITIFFAQYDTWTHKKIIELCQTVAHDYLGGNFMAQVH